MHWTEFILSVLGMLIVGFLAFCMIVKSDMKNDKKK